MAWERILPRRPAVRVAAAAVVASGLALAPFATPMLPVDAYVRYARALGIDPGTDEGHELAELPQFYADMFGWEEKAATVAEVYHALPAADRERAAIFADNYGRAGAEAFRAELAEVFEQEVRPALRRYLDFLETEYAPAARSTIAVAENPGGAGCYRAAIRYHSTLELAPREIHDLGLRQMAEIQAEMREIARRAFDTGDLPALLQRLATDPEYAFSSRQEIIDFSQAALARAQAAMPRFFGIVPRSDVVIEPYPAFREDSGTGEYQSPAEDGSRPGLYYIPVSSNPEQRPRAVYESLAFHETIPAHQTAE